MILVANMDLSLDGRSSVPSILIMKQMPGLWPLTGVFICHRSLGGFCFVWVNKYLKGETVEGFAAVMMLLIHGLMLLWRMLTGYIIFMPPKVT